MTEIRLKCSILGQIFFWFLMLILIFLFSLWENDLISHRTIIKKQKENRLSKLYVCLAISVSLLNTILSSEETKKS